MIHLVACLVRRAYFNINQVTTFRPNCQLGSIQLRSKAQISLKLDFALDDT